MGLGISLLWEQQIHLTIHLTGTCPFLLGPTRPDTTCKMLNTSSAQGVLGREKAEHLFFWFSPLIIYLYHIYK